MRSITLVCLALLAWSPPAIHGARELPVTLLLPPHAGEGDECIVDIVVLNPTASAAAADLAPRIEARLAGPDGAWPVELAAVGTAPGQIPAGGFAQLRYTFVRPTAAAGRVVLEIDALDRARAVLDLPTAAATPEPAAVEQTIPIAPTPTRSALAGIERAFAQNFGFHNPVYFIYGPDAPAAKFQFSFKYRIIGEAPEEDIPFMPSMKGLYFGYTQRSVWDITAESSPFYDTSYMPEVLFEILAPARRRDAFGLHWLGLQGAVQHESNGRDGDASRSLNIAYLRTGIVLGRMDGWRLIVVPRFHANLSESIGNSDISDYRGFGDLSLAFGRNDHWQVVLNSRLGADSDKYAVQVDFTLPVHVPVANLGAYFHIQYFSGYGESLLSYREKSHAWRAGFAFVR